MITLPPPVSLKSWLLFGLDNTTLLRSMENELILGIRFVRGWDPWSRAMKLSVMALGLFRSALPGRGKARRTYNDWALAFFIDGIKPVGAEGISR